MSAALIPSHQYLSGSVCFWNVMSRGAADAESSGIARLTLIKAARRSGEFFIEEMRRGCVQARRGGARKDARHGRASSNGSLSRGGDLPLASPRLACEHRGRM